MKKYILILFCSFLFATSITSGKDEQKYNLMFNKIKGKVNPSMLTKLKNSKKQFVKEVDVLKKNQNYYPLAKRNIVKMKFNLKGMDVSEAAFLVLQMATKDMDDDIRLIMAEIKSMTAAKQKIRELLKDLNYWISESMPKSGSSTEGSFQIQGSETTYEEPNPGLDDSGLISECRIPRHVLKKYSVTLHYRFKYPILSRIKTLKNYRKCPKNFLKKLKVYYETTLQTENEISEELSLKLLVLTDRRAKLIQTLSNIYKKISQTGISEPRNLR